MIRHTQLPLSGLHILLLGCMSSGKSTVLNALLGSGAFPSGNRATTAQVFKITHDPACTENQCLNPSGENTWVPLSHETLAGWNGAMKENVPAEIHLRLPHLQKKRPVVFYDTPGPNTSKYAEHCAETRYALEKLPLTHIFLVLDMVQLHTKDEEALLNDMGRVMKDRGGIPLLVILNKADVIDIEKESVAEIVAEIRDNVSQHVPAGTRIDIIPVMSKGTEVWRRMIDRDRLTNFEIEFGQYIDWRLCEEIRAHAIMPESVKTSIAEQMEEWKRLQKFSQAFRSSLEYLARRVHPDAELINRNVSKILDYADCRRAITGSGIIALEEYIDSLSPDWDRASHAPSAGTQDELRPAEDGTAAKSGDAGSRNSRAAEMESPVECKDAGLNKPAGTAIAGRQTAGKAGDDAIPGRRAATSPEDKDVTATATTAPEATGSQAPADNGGTASQPASDEGLRPALSRQDALDLLRKYNAEPFHLLHALTVEAVMGFLAEQLGHGAERNFWSQAGLLHDIDFEQWPEEHCTKARELLAEAGAGEDMIHAVCSHGFGICSNIEPVHEMEKVLFAVDELTGLIGAAALMRPSKSTSDMTVSSLKKKFKDKKFAAGCSRDVIRSGAERLGWTLDNLMEQALGAMQATEAAVRLEHGKLTAGAE